MKTPIAPVLALIAAATTPSPSLLAQEWTLADAVREAVVHHPAMSQAGAATRVTDAGADVARAAYLPSVTVSSSAIRFEEPMIVAPLHGFNPMAPPSFSDGLIRSRLGLGYTLFDGGLRRSTLAAARAASDGAVANRRMVEAQVVEATVDAYNGAATATLVLQAAERQRSAIAAEVARADSAWQAGAAPRVETLRARAALAQAEADHVSAESSLTAARRILARLTGREAVPATALTIPRLRSDAPSGAVPSDAPEVAAAAAGLEAARARHRAARGSFLPRVSLSTGLDQFGATDHSFTHEWQAGLQLSLPVFLGGARLAEVRRRAAEADEAEAALERARLELSTGLDRAVSALAAAEGRVTALTAAEEQWVEVVRIEALALAEGSGIQRDLLAAEASLFGVRAELARARASVVSARVGIARASGVLTEQWLSSHLETSP